MDNPLDPVYVGGCQGGCLGVPVEVFDHDLPEGSEGKPLPHGEAGDLVSTGAFPNIPLFLWNDPPAAGSSGPGPKYVNAYFARFRNVWAQGDFCAIHPLTGNIHLLGRSDGVLNPSGIRFGSADIYAVLERRLTNEVKEGLCVGQRRPQDLDERVVLFLMMKDGVKLDKAMVRKVKTIIGEELTKRHVPKYVFELPEIPVSHLRPICQTRGSYTFTIMAARKWDSASADILHFVAHLGHRQHEEGRAARQAHHFGEDGQGKRNIAEPWKSGVLLSIPGD